MGILACHRSHFGGSEEPISQFEIQATAFGVPEVRSCSWHGLSIAFHVWRQSIIKWQIDNQKVWIFNLFIFFFYSFLRFSFEAVKPLGRVEILPSPYVTESTRIAILLPTFEHQINDAMDFVMHYEKTCMEHQDNTFLMMVRLSLSHWQWRLLYHITHAHCFPSFIANRSSYIRRIHPANHEMTSFSRSKILPSNSPKNIKTMDHELRGCRYVWQRNSVTHILMGRQLC